MSHIDSRDDLLDWAWLDRVYNRDGIGALALRLRNGAEQYGGPVAAIADAVVSPGRYHHLKDGCDLQLEASLKIMRGSWSPAPEGPHWPPRSHSWLAIPPKNRARLIEQTGGQFFAPDAVTVPPLADLRLVRGVECAIVAHTSGIWACDVSRKGDLIASGSRDASLALWDAQTGVLRTRICSPWPEVRECAFTPDGRFVVALHQEELRIWHVDTSSLAAVMDTPSPRHSVRWRRLAASPGSRWLVVAVENEIAWWDLREGRLTARVALQPPDYPSLMCALGFTSDDELRAVGLLDNGDVVMCDLTPSGVHRIGRIHTDWLGDRPRSVPLPQSVHAGFVTPDGRYFAGLHCPSALVHEARTLVIDLQEGSIRRLPTLPGRALALSPNGSLLATVSLLSETSARSHLCIWTFPALDPVVTIPIDRLGCWDIPCALAFTPDSTSVVLGGWDGVVRTVRLAAFASQLRND